MPLKNTRTSILVAYAANDTSLHFDSDSGQNSVNSAIVSSASDCASPPVEMTSLFASANSHTQSHVLLATARVRIGTVSGRSIVMLALLDQGSEATFISEALAQALRAKHLRRMISISAVGGTPIGTV